MSRIKRPRPQRPIGYKSKSRVHGTRVRPLEVRRIEVTIGKSNIYKENDMSYEEFCEPFKKIGKILKDKGKTPEEMKKRHERSRAEYAKKHYSR